MHARYDHIFASLIGQQRLHFLISVCFRFRFSPVLTHTVACFCVDTVTVRSCVAVDKNVMAQEDFSFIVQ